MITNLTIRDLENTTVPEAVFEFKNLTNLEIYSSHKNKVKITNIPDDIGNLIHLKALSFGGISIEHLPDCVFELPKLTRISISGTGLRKIPQCFNLPLLKYANFNDNQLATVPEQLFQLPELNSLNLNRNQLITLPLSLIHI